MAQSDNTLPTLIPLTAITPLDGRYRRDIELLVPYFSEFALIKTRCEVEIRFLLALSEKKVIRAFSQDEKDQLIRIYKLFSISDAEQVKSIEHETKHDVKALERFLRETFKKSSLSDIVEMIHIGLTSEDINNLSYRLMIQRARKDVLLPYGNDIKNTLARLAKQYKQTPMLARTHGQPAIPTTLGKELAVFASRLSKEIKFLQHAELTGKMSGAVGNFNALVVAFPSIDWIAFSNTFIASLGLTPNLLTTQINAYEDALNLLQIMQRINNILIDFDQDMWRYISDEWFVQEVREKEVGSSTMPQKVNPIRFENSEGNLGLANALIEFMTRKLPVSRLQRDLSDSTVMRNFGTIFAYTVLGLRATREGLERVQPNLKKIDEALQKDWTILAEAVQTILRREGIKDPYSLIKSLTRGEHIDASSWKKWIDTLDVSSSIKQELAILTPASYIGLAATLVDELEKE